MYSIKYLVFIWKRGPFGIWFKVPVIRTIHTDAAGLKRIGRWFTFEDLMRATTV